MGIIIQYNKVKLPLFSQLFKFNLGNCFTEIFSPDTLIFPPRNQALFPSLQLTSETLPKSSNQRSLDRANVPQNMSGSLSENWCNSWWLSNVYPIFSKVSNSGIFTEETCFALHTVVVDTHLARHGCLQWFSNEASNKEFVFRKVFTN